VGATAADVSVPNGIVVPRYANHPDAIWTPQSAFDDHFDSPTSGTPNAKWVRTFDASASPLVYTQAASKLCLGIGSPSNTATYYNNTVTQSLPVQTNHTVSLKVLTESLAYAGSSAAFAALNLNLAYGANAGGVQVQLVAFNGTSVKGTAVYFNYGAAFGTLYGYYYMTGMPPYWRFVYNTTNTTVSFSFDGTTWFPIAVITAAQSGFGSNAPAQFVINAQVNFVSYVFAQIDWIKHV
jgi:hypothetical protein